jgi:hypothetical protein
MGDIHSPLTTHTTITGQFFAMTDHDRQCYPGVANHESPSSGFARYPKNSFSF